VKATERKKVIKKCLELLLKRTVCIGKGKTLKDRDSWTEIITDKAEENQIKVIKVPQKYTMEGNSLCGTEIDHALRKNKDQTTEGTRIVDTILNL
jgi:hypothetical protein